MLGVYFVLAERVSEGRRFLDLALSATSDEHRSTSASNCWPPSATWPPRNLISSTPSRPVNCTRARRDRRGTATARARPLHACARAFAFRRRAAGRTDGTECILHAGGSGRRLGRRRSRPDPRHSRCAGGRRGDRRRDGSGRPASLRRDRLRRVPLPGLLLEAWVAERRRQCDLAEERYRSALDIASRSGSTTTPRSRSRASAHCAP